MSKKKHKKKQCDSLDKLKWYRKAQESASKLALNAGADKKRGYGFFEKPRQINYQHTLILLGLLAFSAFSTVAGAPDLSNRRKLDAEKNFHNDESENFQCLANHNLTASVGENFSQFKPAPTSPKQHLTTSIFSSYIFPSAKASVVYDAAYLAQSKIMIVDALLNLSKKKNIACKINSLFEKANTNFKLYVGHDDEGSGEPGSYNPELNFVILKSSSVRSPVFEGMLNHELHHAFVCYQNIARERVFYLQDRETGLYQKGPAPIPCEAGFPKGQFDCSEFKAVWARGYQKIHKIMAILERYKDDNYFHTDLSKNDEVLLDNYLKVIGSYKPLLSEMLIPESKAKEFYAFDPTGKNILIRYENGVEQHISEIKKQADNYIAYIFTSVHENMRPLTDLLDMINRYKDKEKDLQILERDAVIHQLYERTPELMEFLFEGINRFHQKRSAKSYQDCTGYSENDSQQASFKHRLS